MRVLTVNAGSSTLKLSLVDNGTATRSTTIEGWRDASEPIAAFAESAGTIDAVGHRIVHGGAELTSPVIVDDKVHEQLAALVDLAPLHQPRSLVALDAAGRALAGRVPHVACFDTTFHATLPPEAATYAIPSMWRERWPLRRYGFHGLSHAYASRRAAELAGRPIEELRIVSCHLGAGASLCAVEGGKSVDTTMGFTPLDGLVMSTRSGSIDPGLVTWLVEHGGLSAVEVADALEHQSGLLALAGTGDLRTILAARAHDADAALAFDVYIRALRRNLGAMVAVMHTVDAFVFTGGVGEHAPEVRAASGVPVDPAANARADGDTDISASDSLVRTFVVTAREDLEIAREVESLLAGPAA